MSPTPPNLSGVALPFAPVSYWQAGTFDPIALLSALEQQPGLEPFTDGGSNLQGAVRLDYDIDSVNNVGFWVTVPDTIALDVVQAGVSAYVPPPPPSTVATADDHRAVSDAYVTTNLASVPIPRDQLETILQGMLQLSEQFIPKLQGAIANWAQLTATQKDRILEDLASFALVQMQYTTGLLPTSPPSPPPS